LRTRDRSSEKATLSLPEFSGQTSEGGYDARDEAKGTLIL